MVITSGRTPKEQRKLSIRGRKKMLKFKELKMILLFLLMVMQLSGLISGIRLLKHGTVLSIVILVNLNGSEMISLALLEEVSNS